MSAQSMKQKGQRLDTGARQRLQQKQNDLQSQEKQRLKSTNRSKQIVRPQNKVLLPPVKIYEQQEKIKGDTFYNLRKQTENYLLNSQIEIQRRASVREIDWKNSIFYTLAAKKDELIRTNDDKLIPESQLEYFEQLIANFKTKRGK